MAFHRETAITGKRGKIGFTFARTSTYVRTLHRVVDVPNFLLEFDIKVSAKPSEAILHIETGPR